jgi:hypothetical protein
MGNDIYFRNEDCQAKGIIEKLACRLKGPAWKETGRVQTQDLDDVTEKCKRCGFERPQPKW